MDYVKIRNSAVCEWYEPDKSFIITTPECIQLAAHGDTEAEAWALFDEFLAEYYQDFKAGKFNPIQLTNKRSKIKDITYDELMNKLEEAEVVLQKRVEDIKQQISDLEGEIFKTQDQLDDARYFQKGKSSFTQEQRNGWFKHFDQIVRLGKVFNEI